MTLLKASKAIQSKLSKLPLGTDGSGYVAKTVEMHRQGKRRCLRRDRTDKPAPRPVGTGPNSYAKHIEYDRFFHTIWLRQTVET